MRNSISQRAESPSDYQKVGCYDNFQEVKKRNKLNSEQYPLKAEFYNFKEWVHNEQENPLPPEDKKSQH